MGGLEQLLEPLDARATGAILQAISRGYGTRNVINERFPHQELAKITAGHFRNRQIDEYILSGVPPRAPHVDVKLNQIPKTGHAYISIHVGELVLLVAPRPKYPVYGRLPKSSKTRLDWAKRSRLRPAQISLFSDSQAVASQPSTGDFVLGVISHYPDERNLGVMGGADLLLVDQSYGVRSSIDLVARHESLRDVQPAQPKVIPVSVRIKG